MIKTNVLLTGVDSHNGKETVFFTAPYIRDGEQYVGEYGLETGKETADRTTKPCPLSKKRLGHPLFALSEGFHLLGIYGRVCLIECNRSRDGDCSAFKEG